jgi:hypothetical protein
MSRRGQFMGAKSVYFILLMMFAKNKGDQSEGTWRE